MSGLVESDYRQHRAEILARWDDAARAHPLTSGASHDALRAGMAAWLDGAADPLDGSGEQLELEQVIAAYALLRAAIEHDRASAEIDDTIVRFAARRANQLRQAAARASAHAQFLADASAALASSLDYDATLERVARLAVPLLADWCVVDLVDESTAELRRVSVAHRDPALSRLAREWALRYPTAPARSRGVAEVVRTRQPELVPEVPDALLVAEAHDADELAQLRVLGIHSYLIAPLVARGRTFGAITLVSAAPDRRYGPFELELAREVGYRAALAIENARSYRDARQAVLARDQLLAIVSHDLRNPLGALSLMLQMMREAPDDRDGPRRLDAASRAVARMTRLVNDLLDTSAIHGGRFTIKRDLVDPAAIVLDAIELYRGEAAHKQVALVPELVKDVRVPCDPGRVAQALGNLLGNAIKFSRPGDRIAVQLGLARDAVQIVVADTGPGIAAADVDHIFEPYWTTARDARKGSGLGLYITKGIAEAHGGRVWVDSAPGRGTRIGFTLPGATAASCAAPPPHAAGPP